MWTSGRAAMERPVCVLIHWLVTFNIVALIATQAFLQFTTGQTAPYSVTWIVLSVLALFVHILFGFIHAWLAGDPISFGSGDTDNSGSDASSWADAPGSGDGGSSDGGNPT